MNSYKAHANTFAFFALTNTYADVCGPIPSEGVDAQPADVQSRTFSMRECVRVSFLRVSLSVMSEGSTRGRRWRLRRRGRRRRQRLRHPLMVLMFSTFTKPMKRLNKANVNVIVVSVVIVVLFFCSSKPGTYVFQNTP